MQVNPHKGICTSGEAWEFKKKINLLRHISILPSKTNLLPLLSPLAVTAAEVNMMIFPYSCQTGSQWRKKKKKKVMKGQTKGTIKCFQQRFQRPIQVLWHFWSGKNFSGIIVLIGNRISRNQAKLIFYFFFQVWRRNCCCWSISCTGSSVLLSDPWHFVSHPWVPSANVPHLICIYRVCLRDKTTQGASLGGNWDCRHLASLMSAIQH